MNLIDNGRPDAGFDGWIPSHADLASDTVFYSENDPLLSASFKINGARPVPPFFPGFIGTITTFIRTVPGTQYPISFWANGDSSGGCSIFVICDGMQQGANIFSSSLFPGFNLLSFGTFTAVNELTSFSIHVNNESNGFWNVNLIAFGGPMGGYFRNIIATFVASIESRPTVGYVLFEKDPPLIDSGNALTASKTVNGATLLGRKPVAIVVRVRLFATGGAGAVPQELRLLMANASAYNADFRCEIPIVSQFNIEEGVTTVTLDANGNFAFGVTNNGASPVSILGWEIWRLGMVY